jgi:non-specific serine/threonine protein kinase
LAALDGRPRRHPLANHPDVADATEAMKTRAEDRTPDTGQDAAAPLTAREAAAWLGVNERTIRRAIACGALPATKEAGVYRIAPAALVCYRERHRETTRRPAPTRPRPLPTDADRGAGPVRAAPVTALRPPAPPTPLTSLVGREREVAAVVTLLRRDDVRLVTLTGPGGVGKTRLALAVAAAVSDAFADGVAFVALATIRDPGLVVPAIARVLAVREAVEAPVLERVMDALRDRVLLLVLDNVEQVLAAAPLVVELLAACPRVKALATSRALLRVSGETPFPVPSLALSEDPGDRPCPPSVEQVCRSDAVRLFADRVRSVRPGFVLTEETAPAAAEICARLDGLPLAIELAAARVGVLSPGAIVGRLQHRLPLLTGGARDAPARQRTMRDAIAWSFDLLAPEERALFRRLAVFAGGFTLERVAAVGRVPGNPISDALEGLTTLVEGSLVRRVERTGGEPRFAMLETVREFGLEQLAASGEEESVRGTHARHFLALAERSEPDIYRGCDLIRLLGALEDEHADLRAALEHLEATGAAEAFLRLAGALAPFWLFHSHRGEGRGWLERALAIGSSARVSASTRAKALGGAATLAFTQGDYGRAAALAEENLALQRELGERQGIATALNLLGAVTRAQGACDQAAPLLEEAVALFEEIGDPGWIASARGNLGILAYWRGDPGHGAALLEGAVYLYRQAGDRYPYGAAVALSDLALVTCDRGDHARAATLFAESLARWREVGTREGLIDWLARAAVLAEARGQPERAIRLFGAAEALREAIGYAFECPERSRHQRALAAARATIGEGAYAAAMAAGGALSPDEAVAEASRLVADLLGSGAPPPPAHGLTPRQATVLRLVAAGRSDREIADALFVSRRTASKHVAAILAKLGVPTRAAAATQAVRLGLV